MTDLHRTIIVTGLPRSGTSLMMQALVAGGVQAVTDATRPPDASNPRGYFELEAVKSLPGNPHILGDTAGRCVKVIHSLVTHLPPEMPLDVLVMRRDLDQIVQSQKSMLARLGRANTPLPPAKLKEIFAKQLADAVTALRARPSVRLLDVDYTDFVARPLAVGQTIADFLARPMDVAAMSRAVDPSLHRERGGAV